MAAHKHFESLNSEILAFLGSKPYSTSVEFDAGESRFRLIGHVREQPPIRFGIRVGDVVHNLASALDCTAYEVARMRAGREVARTSFPIFGDIWTYRKFRRRKNCWMRCLKMTDRAYLQRLQPYRDRDEGCLHPLANLFLLWNQDKHRVVATTVSVIEEASYNLVPGQDVVGLHKLSGRFGPIEDGADIAWVEVETNGPSPQMYMQGEFRIEIAFENGLPVLDSLAVMGDTVAEIVEEFAKQFPP